MILLVDFPVLVCFGLGICWFDLVGIFCVVGLFDGFWLCSCYFCF